MNLGDPWVALSFYREEKIIIDWLVVVRRTLRVLKLISCCNAPDDV